MKSHRLLPRPLDGIHSAKRDFGLGRGASEEHIRKGSVTREQRSPRPKDPLPEGLRRFWILAALLVSRRSLRICSFLAPCQNPNLPQQSVSYPTVWAGRACFWSLGIFPAGMPVCDFLLARLPMGKGEIEDASVPLIQQRPCAHPLLGGEGRGEGGRILHFAALCPLRARAAKPALAFDTKFRFIGTLFRPAFLPRNVRETQS